jgi:hypothetical protein
MTCAAGATSNLQIFRSEIIAEARSMGQQLVDRHLRYVNRESRQNATDWLVERQLPTLEQLSNRNGCEHLACR